MGERLITAKSEPVFGGVYKLAAVEDERGTSLPRSRSARTWRRSPFPTSRRSTAFYGNDTGKAIADYITVYDETLDDTKALEIFDPQRHLEEKDGV